MKVKLEVAKWLRLAALAVVLVGSSAAATEAKPLLHALFNDGMVIQRDVAAPVWGWAEPGAKVEVTLADAKGGKTGKWETKADAQGRWEAKIGPVTAGGPYALTVKGKGAKTIKDVLFGDVYLCAGGKDITVGVAETDDGGKEVAAANFPKIRIYVLNNSAAATPIDSFGPAQSARKWNKCDPKTIGPSGSGMGFSAIAYFFGREMFKQTNVPIGLIRCGSCTHAEQLVSEEALAADPDFKAQVEAFRKDREVIASKDAKGNYVTGRYNAMIAPLTPLAIRGVIWAQGENDPNQYAQHQGLLTSLVKDWASRFTKMPDGKCPFGIVMLAGYRKAADKPVENTPLPSMREAQFRAAQDAPDCGIASAVDLGDATAQLSPHKQEVGRRLALFMLHATGQKPDLVWSGPVFKEMKIEGGKIRVTFDQVGGGLTAKGGEPLKWFAISGADKKFVKAEAKIDGNDVIVSAAEVSKPVAVRYAWANNPEGANLYNKEGLPALPFRTDTPQADK